MYNVQLIMDTVQSALVAHRAGADASCALSIGHCQFPIAGVPVLASSGGLIILLVIAAVSWIVRKLSESSAAKRQQQQTQAPPPMPAKREQSAAYDMEHGKRGTGVQAPRPAPTAGTMAPSREDPRGIPKFQTQGQRYAGGAPTTYRQAPRPAARPAAGVNAPPFGPEAQLHQGDLAQGVDEEMERQRQRMELERRQREQRMATLAPQEADTAAIAARLVHVRPAVSASAAPAGHVASSRLLGLLKQSGGLRNALIYHEVFSPPKSMRQDQDIWNA